MGQEFGQKHDVLIGRIPRCGHVVAIDADTSARARREMAKQGLDIQTVKLDEGKEAFGKGISEHAGCRSAR